MSKIRRDVHGLYLIAGGYYFRPLFPIGYCHRFKSETQFGEGDTVKASHKGGTPLASVKSDDVRETWYSHGATSGRESVECFRPEYDSWP